MQSAPNEATPKGPCPSAEELAAYIDRVLEQEEADRVTAHLADCEDCFEVYSETMRFLLDSEPESNEEETTGKVVPFVPPAPPAREIGGRRWYPIAAVLAIGVGAGAYFELFARLPQLATAEITASLPVKPALEGKLWRGVTTRGGGDGEEAEPVPEAPFRMGVQLVNLQVALKAGQASQAQDTISRILGLLKDQYFSDDLQKAYAALTGTLSDPKKAPRDFLPEASRLAGESREAFTGDETTLDLGQWVEAGRLAALAEDPSFFQQGETRSFLHRLLWRERLRLGETKLDPAARQSLWKIDGIVSKGDLESADYEELKQRFGQILEVYYPD
jgi:hypothetical protein